VLRRRLVALNRASHQRLAINFFAGATVGLRARLARGCFFTEAVRCYARPERSGRKRSPRHLAMRPRASYVLISAAILFLGMALFFWASASLTRLTCCDLSWVSSAPDSKTLDVRLQARDRALSEVVRLKRQLRIYSLLSLLGAAGLAIVYRRRRKRRSRRYSVSGFGEKV
jgi:hypothetical protein